MTRLIFLFLINGLSLYVAGRVVPGFFIPLDPGNLAVITLIFTGLDALLLPILKAVLKPVIWLTIGLLGWALNALMLIILDNISEKVIISGAVPLIIGTLLITTINALCRHLLLPKS